MQADKSGERGEQGNISETCCGEISRTIFVAYPVFQYFRDSKNFRDYAEENDESTWQFSDVR